MLSNAETRTRSPATRPVSWRHEISKSSGPGLFLGTTLCDLAGFLQENGLTFPPRSWLKLAATASQPVHHSTCALKIENAVYGPVLARQAVKHPLFIIGHWQSGTAPAQSDVDRPPLGVCQFLANDGPTFLLGEWIVSTISALLLPAQRMGIDNVAMPVPWEEEFALARVTEISPYLTRLSAARRSLRSLSDFPRRVRSRGRRWKPAFLKQRKLAWKYQRPLILKSAKPIRAESECFSNCSRRSFRAYPPRSLLRLSVNLTAASKVHRKLLPAEM